MTKEERAEERYPVNELSGVDYWTYARSCYIQGATDQQPIDYKNASKAFCKVCPKNLDCWVEESCSKLENFIKELKKCCTE